MKTIPVRIRISLFLLLVASGLICPVARAESLTRAEALKIAEAYCNYRWQSSAKNAFQGRDADGVEVHTPNLPNSTNANTPDPKLWTIDAANTGMPYKWGGFDTLESFETGIKKGKAAGDIYSPEKRRLGGAAVSGHAVGIDCSGFISRCWKLSQKQSTSSLPSICKILSSPVDLKPGDIMNAQGGHVILFAKWLDDAKSRALFYEASPYCKVMSNTYLVTELIADGFQPMRYKLIRD